MSTFTLFQLSLTHFNYLYPISIIFTPFQPQALAKTLHLCSTCAAQRCWSTWHSYKPPHATPRATHLQTTASHFLTRRTFISSASLKDFPANLPANPGSNKPSQAESIPSVPTPEIRQRHLIEVPTGSYSAFSGLWGKARTGGGDVLSYLSFSMAVAARDGFSDDFKGTYRENGMF